MRTWFFHPGATLTGWLMWLLGPPTVEGAENVPPVGPLVVVANHASNLDPPFLGSMLGRHTGRVIHFMAKDEMRRWPLVGWLASQAGAFFVRRGSGDRAAQRMALDLLADGRILALFPEGTRSRDGVLREGRAGAALLAMRSGAPVLPVGIIGTHRLLEPGRFLPRRHPFTIRIGRPFRLPQMDDVNREALRAGAERIMREIAALLPPDQRGRWDEPEGASEGSADDR
ncbi:MAG TPA: lysophospholipid acyltransferase family protein [candidate division Zixibacteria bacterium]|nr:lysophospholipid acyltransferase family protein [candidate division Zixibacteria bacterium]